jgi:uncharacterized protein with HEPN domain
MSSDQTDREWRFYVEDMIGFCERVQSFTSGVSREDFVAERMRYDATVRNIELIGEAATHVLAIIRQTAENIPWRMMIATRNQLIHGYAGIDDDVLWSIIQSDVSELLASLRAFLSVDKAL